MADHRRRKKVERVRQDVILDHLRRQIVTGAIAPGEQLPTHQQIEQKLRASRVTVQRAFERLVEDGFIWSKPKIGRFVVDRPPHLSRYGLVFAGAPDEGSKRTGLWSRFHTAVIDASRKVADEEGITFAQYFHTGVHLDGEGCQSLMRDIKSQRLAGIIFTSAPHVLEGTHQIQRSRLPQVNAYPTERPPGVRRIVDGRHVLYRAIDRLITDGRRRFAVITMPEHGYPDEFQAAVASRGGMTHPLWTHAVHPEHKQWVRHAVEAILGNHVGQAPDCLLITDDHLVEPVAEALWEFGVKVPEQLRVIGHWNFPFPYRGRPVPIELLGFDAHELVRLWVNSIDAQRRGEKVAPIAMVPARFARELPDALERNEQETSGQLVS